MLVRTYSYRSVAWYFVFDRREKLFTGEFSVTFDSMLIRIERMTFQYHREVGV